ncbi:MAG: nucleoside triphosphate pyrophosphohydrolase, partial [Clostridiales bacterium]
MNNIVEADAAKWRQLVEIMSVLRGENGCPWDREQDHFTLKKYFVEETYEVLDAIDARDDVALCDELGDALLQVIFHAQIAAEQGRFTINDVVAGISAKMLRRHPHVFGSDQAATSGEVLTKWEEIKAAEKASGSPAAQKRGLMYVNDNLPALLLAQKVQDKAARVGFDWPDISGPRAKLTEEIGELDRAETPDEHRDELGDCLFALVNMAR